MILQAYDYLLIAGILLCMVVFYAEMKILVGKKKFGNGVKLLAIFGILFFLTAIIGGSAITSYVTKDVINDKVTGVSNKLGNNKYEVFALKDALAELRKGVQNSNSFEDRAELLNQIAHLESKIDNLLDSNKDLKDDIQDLEDEIEDLYTLIPGGMY